MDISNAFTVAFILFLALFFWRRRKQVEIQRLLWPFLYMLLYRTQVGIKWMGRVAKRFPAALHGIGWAAIISGFAGMLFIVYELVLTTLQLLSEPETAAGIMPVLPIEAKGVFFVPFEYWILCIFAILIVHEFAHGLIARRYGCKIKSSGLAALGVILPIVPGAFVEPDEAELAKRKPSQQMAVFAAGPFANILSFFAVFLLLAGLTSALMGTVFIPAGVLLANVTDGGPAHAAGLASGDLITGINDAQIQDIDDFTLALEQYSPGDTVIVQTNESERSLTLAAKPDDANASYAGVMAMGHIVPAHDTPAGRIAAALMQWIVNLLGFLAMLNLGIGLFNLLPLWIVDGGRMLQTALLHMLPKRHALLIWHAVSFVTLTFVLVNVIGGFF